MNVTKHLYYMNNRSCRHLIVIYFIWAYLIYLNSCDAVFRHGGAGEDVTGEPEAQADGEEEEDEYAGLEVLGEEDKGCSQGPVEEESFAALSTSMKRSRDSSGLADLLGQTNASGQYRKDPLTSTVSFSSYPCIWIFEPHCAECLFRVWQ